MFTWPITKNGQKTKVVALHCSFLNLFELCSDLRTFMTACYRSIAPTTTIINKQCQHQATSLRNHAQHPQALSHKHSPSRLRPNKPLAARGWGWTTTLTHGSERPPAAMYTQHNTCWLQGWVLMTHNDHLWALPPQSSTHGNECPPAPMYAQHNMLWLHHQQCSSMFPSTTTINPWQQVPTSAHVCPTQHTLAACWVPTTNEALPPQPSTHSNAMYTQHNTCWLHVKSPPLKATADAPFHHNHRPTVTCTH